MKRCNLQKRVSKFTPESFIGLALVLNSNITNKQVKMHQNMKFVVLDLMEQLIF
jgi:hypothetical protein